MPDAGSPPIVPDAAVPIPDGADFSAEARLLFRIVACGNDDPLPNGYDPKVIAHHCKLIRAQASAYRTKYVENAGRAFFDELVPDDVPTTVVYPFGGGDLISALVVFPDATEITTISLELAGDPRRITQLEPAALKRSLATLRFQIGGTLENGSNTSELLSASQRNDLPVQVSSFLMGLAANGFEPVGMRYFTLADDGAINYLDAAEIETLDPRAKSRKGDWRSPSFSEAFANVEIQYRKQGDAAAPVRVHRHLGWNLADYELDKHPQLLRHLEQKGRGGRRSSPRARATSSGRRSSRRSATTCSRTWPGCSRTRPASRRGSRRRPAWSRSRTAASTVRSCPSRAAPRTSATSAPSGALSRPARCRSASATSTPTCSRTS